MAISTLDALVEAMGSAQAAYLRLIKASVATQLAGGYSSLWRSAGTPVAPAIPSASAVLDNSSVGGLNFLNPTGGAKTYLGKASLSCSVANQYLQLHDRIAQSNSIVANVTTDQPAVCDVTGSGSNVPARIGAADFSNLTWWYEIYTDIGVTATTMDVKCRDGAGAPFTINVPLGGASPAYRTGRLFPIVPPAGTFISKIESAQLTATTGTAGALGFSATRLVADFGFGAAGENLNLDWASLGLPVIEDSTCLAGIVLTVGAATGTYTGAIKLVQG